MILPKFPLIRTRAPYKQALAARLLRQGWVAQARPLGRVIRICVSEGAGLLVSLGTGAAMVTLPHRTQQLLVALLRPSKDWSAYLAQRSGTQIWLMDCLLVEGVHTSHLTLAQRFERMPPPFIGKDLQTLWPIRSIEGCEKALQKEDVPELMFRHLHTPGFDPNASMILYA